MADFNKALAMVLKNEGGYVNDPADTGGETFKGIARNFNPNWEGWQLIDALKTKEDFPACLNNNESLSMAIRNFYYSLYWKPIKGNAIENEEVASSIFDYGINAGVRTSIKMVQGIVKTSIDGIIGANSLAKLNGFDSSHFLDAFALAKIARYVDLVEKRPTNKKFFYGWVRRSLGR